MRGIGAEQVQSSVTQGAVGEIPVTMTTIEQVQLEGDTADSTVEVGAENIARKKICPSGAWTGNWMNWAHLMLVVLLSHRSPRKK